MCIVLGLSVVFPVGEYLGMIVLPFRPGSLGSITRFLFLALCFRCFRRFDAECASWL